MNITRRQVVVAMGAVAAASAAAAGVTAVRWWDAPPAQGLSCLGADEHDFVQVVAEAWLPAGSKPALSGADAELGLWVDAVLAGLVRASARELKLSLQALDSATLPTRLSAFRNLNLGRRIDVLPGWLHSDLWLLHNGITALSVLVGVGWTTHPQVLPFVQPHFPCGYGR